MKFDENDIYVIHSISTKGKNGFWVKCEQWDFEGKLVYVFNRPDGFGVLQSDDGNKTGLNEVTITCKKVNAISDVIKFDKNKEFVELSDNVDMSLGDYEKVIFNYDDILNNNFMIAGQFILHQKFESNILGELNPWSGYTKSLNRDLYKISNDEVLNDFEIRKVPYCRKENCELCKDADMKHCSCKNECTWCSEALLYKDKSGNSYIKHPFGEDVYDEEEYERIYVTLRWYGRVEGGCFINTEDDFNGIVAGYDPIQIEHNGVSLDYIQVIE